MNASLSSPTDSATWLPLVRDKVAGIRFGVVQIVVHDGKVTQIECTEKTRLDDSPRPARAPRR